MTESPRNGKPEEQIEGMEELYRMAGNDISRYNDLLKILFLQRNLATQLGKTESLAESLDLIIDMCLKLPGTDSAGIYVLDQQTLDLVLSSHRGFSEEFISNASSYDSTTIQYMIVMEGNSTYMDLTDPLLSGKKMLLTEGLKCFGMIPVRSNGNIIGVLNLCSHERTYIPEMSRMAAETVASQLGSVLTRIREEEELRKTSINFRAMFDSLSDFLFVLDVRGTILEVNAEAIRCLGYDQEDLAGKPITDLLTPGQTSAVEKVLSGIKPGDTATFSESFYTRKGEPIPMETRIGTGFWNKGEVRFALARRV